jgi:preprotein translocase subunit SecB
MAEEDQAAQENDQPKPQIKTQKVYLKDVSFETPSSPQIFVQEWKPELTIDFGSSFNNVGEDHYEVVLALTVTTKVEDKTAYLAEVHQAGIFLIQGLDQQELQRALNVACLRVIYPYACAAVSDLVSKGGFPQLVLSPVSFSGIYRQRMQQAQEQGLAQAPATDS